MSKTTWYVQHTFWSSSYHRSTIATWSCQMRCKLTATSFPWKRNLNTQRRVLRTTIFIHHMRSLDGVVALEFHKCSRCAVVLQAHFSTWKRIIFYVNNQWKTWVSLTSLALFHLFFVKIWRKIDEKPTKWRKSAGGFNDKVDKKY